MNMSCPRCQSQQITKATEIVNIETAIRPEYGPYSGTIIHMQSLLAYKLMPPPYPQKAMTISQILIIICASLGGILLLFFSFLLVLVCGILGGLCLLGLVLSIVHTVRTGPQRKTEYQAKVARWQTAMSNWDQVYYCHTCSSVYLLHTRAFALVDYMHSLL